MHAWISLHGYRHKLLSRETKKRYTFSMEIHELSFKALDRDNEPSCFQEELTNLTKYRLE